MFSPLSGQSDRHARSIHHIFAILGLTSRAARVDARHHPASRPSICRPTGDRLRVLHIAESYSAGVASALDSYIDATEHDVRHEILGFRRPGSQIGPPPAWLFVDLPAGKLRQTLAIRAKLRRTDADIIHVHSSWAGLFVRATLRRHRRPVVFSPHCYASERTTLRSGTRWLYGRVESMLAYRTDVVAAVGARERAVATRLSGRVPIVTLPHALPNAKPGSHSSASADGQGSMLSPRWVEWRHKRASTISAQLSPQHNVRQPSTVSPRRALCGSAAVTEG
jgi:Glycosyltransferase Family 4